MNNKIKYTNGNVIIEFVNLSNYYYLYLKLINFLTPFFWKCDHQHYDFKIIFKDYSQLPLNLLKNNFDNKKMELRKSSAEKFNLLGYKVLISENEQAVIDKNKQTGYYFYLNEKIIELYISEYSFIHLIEFIRYTVLLLEEARGTIIFHASAVSNNDNELIIICGSKGSGKSTTLLHLINSGYKYFSGDKILLNKENKLLKIRGWPDYPHIGIGSLRLFPDICNKLNLSFDMTNLDPTTKLLIDPQEFKNAVGISNNRIYNKVESIIFPKVNTNKKLINIIDNKNTVILTDNIESPSNFNNVKWHNLFDSLKNKKYLPDQEIINKLKSLPWINISGKVFITNSNMKEILNK